MDNNDIGALFATQEETETVPTSVDSGIAEATPEKFSIWDDEPTPTDYDLSNIGMDDKSYTVASYGKVPYKLLEDSEALFKVLNDRGYVLHSGGDSKDKLCSEAEISSKNIKFYLPFKKFNGNVKAEVAYPFKKAYDLSAFHAFKYEDMKVGMKSFLARTVHILLGKNCNRKVGFIILYTECGKETDYKLDYKLTGSNISTILKHATLLNIPVFNLKNEDALERIKNHITEGQ